MRLFRTIVVIAAAVILSITSSQAAELVMFWRDGCRHCAAWDRDIGPIYRKSDIGRRAPLRMVHLNRERSAISLVQPVIYTPTFVLVDNDRELGRIEGYPGEDFFWGLLERLLQRLPSDAASGLSVKP